MKKSIDINGITTTSLYKDGDCVKLVNLRKKNGVLRPVTPRKIKQTTTQQYVYIFQHNLPQTGVNLIGVRNNNIYLIGPIAETLLTATTGFKSITQIGNMLNILDEKGIKILFWVDTAYKLIETNFGGEQTSTALLPVKVDLKVENVGEIDIEGIFRSGFKTIFSELLHYDSYLDYKSAANTDLRKETFRGLTDKLISILRKEGSPVWFMLACTAIELYDGSYILHSAPVLLGQANDAHTRYSGLNINTNVCDYKQNRAAFVTSGHFILSDTLNNTTDFNESQIATGKAIKSGSMISTTWFPSVIGESGYVDINNSGDIDTKSTIYKNKLKFKINSNIDPKYNDFIKSISVFVTSEICPYDTETVDSVRETYEYEGGTRGIDSYYYKNKTEAEIINAISQNHLFYKVHEITYQDLQTITPGTWIDVDLKDKLGENLINQEQLPVDNFTHHNLLPNAQMVYNGKLHVMDYKQELFRPWPINYFYQTFGKGQFEAALQEGEVDEQVWVEYIAVKIKTETGLSQTIRTTPLLQGEYLKVYNILPFISYPDARATELTIYRMYYDTVGGRYAEQNNTYQLKASENQNFAYYIDPELKPIELTNFTWTDDPIAIPAEISRLLIYRNGMKISGVSNPFYFPAENSLTIGTGVILNAGSNAQRMSEGQFGQYDLYVLTTEGIYSLDTGTTISYNRQSPASLETPITDILCSIPYGMLFIGKRGLYLITGQQTELISVQIEEKSEASSINMTPVSFSDFITNLKDILYDNLQNEIILVSKTLTYNYVYNIDSKVWYISAEKVDFEIKNSSPDLLVVEGSKIKDYSKSETDKALVSFITRPLYFGIDEVKKLDRIFLRGKFHELNTALNQEAAFYRLYGSNDGVQQTLLRGFTIPADKQDRSYKDFDGGLLARSTYRNYTIAFEATVEEQTEISHIDFEIKDDYTNEKLR